VIDVLLEINNFLVMW